MHDFYNLLSYVIEHNLSSLSCEQLALEERRICEIKEHICGLVDMTMQEYGTELDVYELLAIISESITESAPATFSDALSVNKPRLAEYWNLVSSFDKFLYCQLIMETFKSKRLTISEDDFLLSRRLNESFVYVKNPFADEAYDVFSQSFTDPRVRYVQSFKEAISFLDNGTASHCLLPFEEGGGKRIRSVEELIFKYDLKINAVTPVFGFDGSADMKYAMVSKGFTKLARRKDDDRYLEIRLTIDDCTDISELFSIAKATGLGTYKIETLYFDTDEGVLPYISVVFKGTNGDFAPILVYLTLFTQSYTIVGLYKNLE